MGRTLRDEEDTFEPTDAEVEEDEDDEEADDGGWTNKVSDDADNRAWYDTLGISPGASNNEINSAWRERMKKNHPDRVAELDVEFRELAERRAKMLNAAREEGLNRHR